ncbi:21 kDa subunit of NADH dehydrogenase [Aulographum hederae CBS 113979]|uniref:21 kDa subunit of NADH dehydrogenase n=1 Tax=Aulographum hederae CBS 113979 TaxID=1176131 RepID=A0A6G1H4Q7_9PEZI|nr:21 kDa subunit of NADH dehydrogenase [Aulographum hederae CBS 113979]
MATSGAKQAISRVGKAAQFKRYTVQPTGIWARINNFFAIDPSRSTGIPLNPQFRNPPPGSNDPYDYTDPVTVPAGDLAENPYWKRDVRRRYPKLSTVTQADVVGLLTVGSKANPKEDVLQIGDAGHKQLVEVKQEGEKGLATYLQSKGVSVEKSVLGPGGLPPLPGAHPTAGLRKYDLCEDQTYGNDNEYPCRTFQ